MRLAAPRWLSGALTAVILMQIAGSAHGQWPQWGGQDRNFVVETSGLADSWPEDGPKRLWHRKLGSGYSAIVADDGVLYTMYRRKNTNKYEYTIAIEAATGKTIWDKRNTAEVPPETPDHGKRFSGPNATPLIVGDRLFSIGRNATLHCYQKSDGAVLWKHELQKDFGAQIETCGYSPSPIAYGNTIVVPLGRAEGDQREGQSLIAFDQATGEVVWRNLTFRIGHASPILITFDGEDQLVLATKGAIIGVRPTDGELLWTYPFAGDRTESVYSTPVWNGDDVVVCGTFGVSCALKLHRDSDGTRVEEVWSGSKAPFAMSTPVLTGNVVVTTKGEQGPDGPMMAFDLTTGDRLWIKRVFLSATAVGSGGRLIVLDHKGLLGLVTATREGLTIHSQYQVTEQESFTVPTLVGTTLYVRDENNIMAFDLGQTGGSASGA